MPDGQDLVKSTPGKTAADLAKLAARRTAGETFSRADLELMTKGVPVNTRSTIRRQWARVLDWTGRHGYVEVPMPKETCVKWIDANWSMPGKGGRPVSPETVKLSLWVITKAHKVAQRPDGTVGYVSPVGSVEVQNALAGYIVKYVEAGHRPRMASPISPAELAAMVATCDVRSPIGLRDAVALALGYDMGARASELCAVLYQDVELHVGKLNRATTPEHDRVTVDPHRPADIPLPDTAHMIVHVPMSKTDKEGYGDEVYLYAHPADAADTCPVRLFLAWTELLHARGLAIAGPVLRVVQHGGKAPADGRPKRGTVTITGLAYDGLVRLFMRAAEGAGLKEPRRQIVLHGLRAGSAEAAAERGADTPELNRHYRWSQRGTTAQRYAARGKKRRHNPAQRIWRTPTEGGTE